MAYEILLAVGILITLFALMPHSTRQWFSITNFFLGFLATGGIFFGIGVALLYWVLDALPPEPHTEFGHMGSAIGSWIFIIIWGLIALLLGTVAGFIFMSRRDLEWYSDGRTESEATFMHPDPDCPFCKKLAELAKLPAEDIVFEFKHSVAFLGPWQYYPGYCVLVSKEHASELSQLGKNRAAFLEEMAVLAEAIEKCFPPHKLNYELLGNQVPHLHWHLFPRSKDDPDRLRAVWFELEKADKSAEDKKRLETGKLTRAETSRRLREYLKHLFP